MNTVLISLQSELESKQAELVALNKELSTKQHTLDSMEHDPASFFDDELTELFDQFLDEFYSDAFDKLPITIGNGVASSIIKSEDNTFYREAYNNWLDDSSNYDLDDFEEYSELKEEVEQLESDISYLESDIDELISSIEYLLDDEQC